MKIFDTSSIVSVFREVKYPKVLQNCVARGYRLVIPDTVHGELKQNEETYSTFFKYRELFEIRSVNSEWVETLSARFPYLHRGEIGVICLALEEKKLEKKHICILDERKARTFCRENGIRITGLIGLLLWLKNNGDLSHPECRMIYFYKI
jgi:predicted nucleic acid-binding protein